MPSPVTLQTRLRESKRQTANGQSSFPKQKIIPPPPPAYSFVNHAKGAFLCAELRGRSGATPGPSSGGTRPTAPCSKRWRGAGRTSAVCTSAARRRSSTRGWRLWTSKTACSPCSWTGRVKPTCWFITASSTTRPNCAPHWPPAGTASTGTPTPRYCSTLLPSGAQTACPGVTVFLRLLSGSRTQVRCFWHGTAAASSRCSTRRRRTR